MKANNFITINGKRYDAKTGKLLDSTVPKKNQPAATGNPAKSATKSDPKKAEAHKIAISTVETITKPTRPARAAAAKAKSHIHRSKTLNRSAVKAPILSEIYKSKATASRSEANKIATRTQTEVRLEKAKQIARSEAIHKFHNSPKKREAQSNLKENKQQTVDKEAIKKEAAISTRHDLTNHIKQRHNFSGDRRKKPQVSFAHASTAKPVIVSKSNHKKSHRGLVRFATAGLALLLIAGYVAYLNVPMLSMRVAANRAGIAANMPHQPSGYSLNGPIAYNNGQVQINFKSNSDDRNFSVTQQKSSWDSDALLAHNVKPRSEKYTTYQDSGLTVYVLEDGSATWVNAGKLYSLDGQNAQLDSQQILDLATSM